MSILGTVAILALASVGPNIAPIDEQRFRVSIVYDDTSPMGHGNAQVALMKAAERFCRGKGKAVSEGTLELNDAAPLRGKRKALEVSEIYRCVPKQ
jgi:hypothetical protein